jgi:hypothetical protein
MMVGALAASLRLRPNHHAARTEGLEFAADGVEQTRQVGSEGGDGADDRERDQRGKQSVLQGGDTAAIVLGTKHQTSKSVHRAIYLLVFK